jgi:hypothetical protein
MSATAKDGFIPVTNSQAARTLLGHATYSTLQFTAPRENQSVQNLTPLKTGPGIDWADAGPRLFYS